MNKQIIDEAAQVAAGGTASKYCDMGSCQCGSHGGSVTLRDGVPWAKCHGRMPWQRYDGPAVSCSVGYGFGSWAREIARILTEDDPLAALRLEKARALLRIEEIDRILEEA